MLQIPREQVINRLRAADYHFKRKGDRTEIYRQAGSGQRVFVPLRNVLTEDEARVVLNQAGLSAKQIEAFLRECVKAH